MANIVLGVTGSIAAYKAAQVASSLRSAGHEVQVVITAAGSRFITADTLRTLTGRRVIEDLFVEDREFNPLHVSLSEWADVILVAPATANVIGKMACGLADDALSCTLMAAACPLMLAPAMNDMMWQNAAVQDNVATLKRRGVDFVGPAEGRLASGKIGVGRLADVDVILKAVEEKLATQKKR